MTAPDDDEDEGFGSSPPPSLEELRELARELIEAEHDGVDDLPYKAGRLANLVFWHLDGREPD